MNTRRVVPCYSAHPELVKLFWREPLLPRAARVCWQYRQVVLSGLADIQPSDVNDMYVGEGEKL